MEKVMANQVFPIKDAVESLVIFCCIQNDKAVESSMT